jgi:heme oxygenase
MGLREDLKDIHTLAEQHVFAKTLVAGDISVQAYANYLYNLLPCYRIIERKAEAAGVLEGIEGIKRSDKIEADFDELRTTHNLSPVVVPASVRYQEYLHTLEDRDKILAHLYVRHFGDLFGGQIIKSKVPGSGQMYEFDDRSKLISAARAKLYDRTLAAEARLAFEAAIELFEDLVNVRDI